MSTPNRKLAANALPIAVTFAALVATAVVGRWGQPDWCVTPMAAVGLMAGYALPRRWAVATTLSAMLISDALLASYGSWQVAVAVYATMTAAPLLGSLLQHKLPSQAAGAARLVGLSLTPALLFFVVTNFAVWAFETHYAKTTAGLIECYTAALPFLRRMLMGDLTYVGALFGVAMAAGAFSLKGAVTEETAADTAAV
jgi:hypothetical protein